MHRHIIAVFTLSLIFGCSRKSAGENAKGLPTETIAFHAAKELKMESSPPDVIDQVDYIQLDNFNWSGALFGSIDAVKIRNDNIYLLDRRSKSVVVFDLSGRFLAKIAHVGKGPTEYSQITDFDVDAKGNQYFVDGRMDVLHAFDPSNEHRFQKDLPFEVDVIKCLPRDRLLLGLSNWNEEPFKSRFIITDNQLNILDSCLSFDQNYDDAFWISSYQFSNYEDQIFYNKPIDNTVYVFSSEGELTKSFEFDFGSKNVPEEDKLDVEKNFQKFDSYRCLVEFTVVGEKYAVGLLFDKRKNKMYVLDRFSNTLYLSHEKFPYRFIDMDGNTIITAISPGDYADVFDFPKEVMESLNQDKFVLALLTLKN